MDSCSECNVSAKAAAASSDEVTRSPEAVDFEKLLSDLSASFIRVSAEEVDSEIDRWLQLIVLAMNIDRSTVVQVDQDRAFYTTHQWARPGVIAVERGPVQDAISFPWLTRKAFSGEVVALSRLEDLPPEAAKDLADFRLVGNK